MDYRLDYNEMFQCFTYSGRPVYINENESSYLFLDQETQDLVFYIDYGTLIFLCQSKKKDSNFIQNVFRLALLSNGKKNIPTAILIQGDVDIFVHYNTVTSLTSLYQLEAWFKFISDCVYEKYEVGSNNFIPFEPIQIAKVLESLNLNNVTLTEENRKCFNESTELFSFEYNLTKITWFPSVNTKYVKIPEVLTEESIYRNNHPIDVFSICNKTMRYVLVWEAANYSLESVIASNIVFIYFLQDTGSSTCMYTPLLPILQALAVYNVRPAKLISSTPTYVKSKANILIKRAKFNKDNDRKGLYRFHMKLKTIHSVCNDKDCLDLLNYTIFDYNVFKNDDPDTILTYLRTTLHEHNKSEMYIYVLLFGLCLSCLRASKPINTTEAKNLANFSIENLELKQMSTEKKKLLYNGMKEDINIIFNFITPYINYLTGLEESNTNFKLTQLNDECLFFYMRSQNAFSDFLNYLVQTVLPLITSRIA